jgi:DegV family protein with EDD domain
MVKIIVDTTCSLPRPLLKQMAVHVLPQIVIFGEESYRDDSEIDSQTFLKKLRSSTNLPKTAAPPPELYHPIFSLLRDAGDSGIVIVPSSEVSGTARSASIAAQEFTDVDIRVIDSRTVAGGLGQVVLKAWEWAQQGVDIDTIETRVKEMASRERVYFVVDTLEYLYKGGRIGGAQALFGSLLQIKPILSLHDGKIQPVETQRTKLRALKRLQEIVVGECPPGNESHLSIAHIDALDEVDQLANYFRETLQINDIPIYEIPSAIIVHAGPKVIAVSFFTSPK